MPEKETEAKAIRVTLECECGGNMAWTGSQLLTYPPQYPHECELCKNVERSSRKYPYTKYKKEKSDEDT